MVLELITGEQIKCMHENVDTIKTIMLDDDWCFIPKNENKEIDETTFFLHAA